MSKKNQLLDVYFVTTSNYELRNETLNGINYIVVPVTMMVEGVHSGSHGPILHLAQELGRYPESWDGIPVTIGHPNVDGQYVSANSPAILEDWAVGRIFNTHMDGSALKAEAWLDEVSLQRISEDTLERINNGEVIEVSIGIFSDEDHSSGMWNSERYTAIARNHRPNHLALLPDEVGACSIADGCGIRVNKYVTTKTLETQKIIINEKNQEQVLKDLNRIGFSVNELGFSEIREKIASAIYSMDGNGMDHYIEEVYADSVVYAQYNNRVEPRSRKLLKQTYSIDDSGDVKLAGTPIIVKRDISYIPVPTANVGGKTERVKQKIKNNMCNDCVKKPADNLINNKNTAWSEADREFLEAQNEETLEKMTPQAAVTQQQVNTSNKPSREDILAVFGEKPMTNEEFLQLASPEVRLQIQEGLQLRTNQKNAIVAEIVANTEEWPEEDLQLKEMPELLRIHKLATKDLGQTVFVPAGGIGGNTKVEVNKNSDKPKVVPMAPVGVKFS